jgi:Leucine-rich repeat (LRR) protein
MCRICTGDYDEYLNELNCGQCKIIKEIPYLPHLHKLDCYKTNIKIIPSISTLRVLDCCNTNITEIPILPNLQVLDCCNTNITEIPILPELLYLWCDKTKIIKIPILPNLKRLGCKYTNIKEIAILPNLVVLVCSHNIIKEIPYLPKLEHIWYGGATTGNKKIYTELTLKRKLLNLHRLNKQWKTLWKIAEFYTSIKFHPDNITYGYLMNNF